MIIKIVYSLNAHNVLLTPISAQQVTGPLSKNCFPKRILAQDLHHICIHLKATKNQQKKKKKKFKLKNSNTFAVSKWLPIY